MADLWLYTPDYCDGNLCIGNCDECAVADKIFEEEADDGDD